MKIGFSTETASCVGFRRHSRAFSVVELLVVVVILSVLLVVGYGAVSKSLQSAGVTASSSNLRQLALAALAYATENNATLPPHAIFDPALGQNREWCYGYFQFNTSNALAHGILGPYLNDAEKVLRCPVWQALPEVQRMFEAGGKPGLLGYGYNGLNLSALVPRQHSPGRQAGHYQGYPLGAVSDPTKTVMFATSAQRFGQNAAPQEMIWGPDHVIRTPCIRLVNESHAIVAFVDGSVRMVKAVNQTPPTRDGVVLGQLDLDEDGSAEVEIWKK